MKKTVAIILALCIALSLIGCTAQPEDYSASSYSDIDVQVEYVTEGEVDYEEIIAETSSNAAEMSDADTQEVIEILKKCERYPSYIDIDADILRNLLDLYKLNGEAKYLVEMQEKVNQIDDNLRKIRQYCEPRKHELYALYIQCDIDMPIFSSKSTTKLSTYITQIEKVKIVYDATCKAWGLTDSTVSTSSTDTSGGNSNTSNSVTNTQSNSNVTSATSSVGSAAQNNSSTSDIESLRGTTIQFASTIDPKSDGTDYVVSKFEQEYGINVDIIACSVDNYNAEMATLIAAGSAPTVGRSNGDAPVYVGYFQSLDAAKIDYNDSIWDQRMFKLSTYNGSPYLCNTVGNFWTECDIVVYSKSLLKRANCPTPEELDKAGNWNFDTYLMIGQKTSQLGNGCNGASYHSYDCLLHMSGGAVYRADENNRMVNGIDSKTTQIFQKVAQGFKDKYLVSGGTQGLINSTVAISTTSMWSLRKDSNLGTHPNYNDLGFYYLPSFEKGGERPVTGFLRGWGIIRGCNENPATGSKAAEAGGLFLREYLDVNNYNLDNAFVTEEAKTFFFTMCNLYMNTDNYNPYYTTYNLNEGISGIDDDKDVYSVMMLDPAQIPSMMAAIKSAVQKGADNLNKYINQNT